MQKGIYFLYAFWGGKIRSQYLLKNEGDFEEITEEVFSYSENLFNADFEAWGYGPVDRDVYIWYKSLTEEGKNNIDQHSLSVDDVVLGYLDNLIERIFATNDFCLVDLSQEDLCWRNAYKLGKKKKIINEEILNEYTEF